MPDGASLCLVDPSRKRLLVAAKLHEIEGNKLTEAEISMFEMFEREGWSPERRRAYITGKACALAAE